MWVLDHKEKWEPKNWCFWTEKLDKTLESPLGSKEIKPVNPNGNQPWIFIGRTVFKLKLQYFGYLMRRADSLAKTLMLRKTESKRIRGPQRMRKLDDITDSMDMSLSKFREIVKDREIWYTASMRSQKSQTWLSDRTTQMHFWASQVSRWHRICYSAGWKGKVKVAQLCLTLRDPMDCNLPGSSVHGILQAIILE